ncbi:ArnT family glycosyltransferase [Lewinella sp. IMCC34183]|uniref:ArnT family glycosyltransferase n=1 Tax=Lewinella sp. IMCC34183 TaxID=2248762 RepID=UPI000E260EA2|nr:glycosyltransferase family 39 protein [Lewinella sp. IMCC34183]
MNPDLSRRTALALLLAFTLFYAFFRLGAEPYYVGDESRGGINALEMLANGDWVNLHYMGEPDQVRGKPPLLIWCISGSMALFGPTSFALRFPSAVAITLAFYVLFQLITLYRSPRFALLTGLVLLSVSGMAGWHVGRTGDFDALLLLFLLSGMLFLLRYLHFGYRRDVVFTGIFWGFAFLTKGLAMGAYVPGLLLFLLLTRRWQTVVRDRWAWAGAAAFLVFPVFWYTVVQLYGATWEDPMYTGRNVFERLIVHDIYERFTQPGFEGRTKTSGYHYFLYSLDIMFNLWNWTFFAALLFGLYRTSRIGVTAALGWLRARPLLLLSLCLWFPYAMILSVTTHALQQYIVPVLPFVGVATVWGFQYLSERYRAGRYVFLGLLAFTLVRRVYQLDNPRDAPAIARHLPALEKADRIFVELDALANDELYYVYLANQPALLFDTTALNEPVDYLIIRCDSPLRERFSDRKEVWFAQEGVILD